MVDFHRTPGSPIDEALELRSAGDIQAAIGTLLAAAGDALADAEVAVTLGKMLAETGQYERARHWLRHAVKLAPDDLVVRLALGTFLLETGEFSDATSVLSAVVTEVRRRDSFDPFGDVVEAAAPTDFVASAELNLARARSEAGDTAQARALASPWLTNSERWGLAHGILAEIVERENLDPEREAEDALASGQVSPYMVCYLLERLLEPAEPPAGFVPIHGSKHGGFHKVVDGRVVATWYPSELWKTCDFDAVERLIARADQCFDFEWKEAAPEIEAALALARQTFGTAVARRRVERAAYPHISVLSGAPPPKAPTIHELTVSAAPTESEDDAEDQDPESDDEAIRWSEHLAPWNRNDPGQWTIRERLRALADAALKLTYEARRNLARRDPFVANVLPSGMTILGHAPPDALVEWFKRLGYDYGWVSPHFPWTEWHESAAARRWYEEPEDIVAEASIDDLVRLMTTLIRMDRFVENSLQAAIEAGFVNHIAARAAVLLDALDRGEALSASLFANARKP